VSSFSDQNQQNMSPNSTNSTLVTLEQAHGTVMIFAWIIFGSSGILFARYGRSLHFGDKRKIFGADIWFQMHRSIVILAAVTTLLGLILVFARGDNSSVARNRDQNRINAHSAMGVVIAGGTVFQVVIGFGRCAPQSTYRFIFNWIHRSVGILAFLLSVPAIFLVISVLRNYLNGLIIILSLWTGWIVIIVIVLEIIEWRVRSKPSTTGTKIENDKDDHELNDQYFHRVPGESKSVKPGPGNFNNIKLFLFILHFIVAVGLAIPLIVLIWQQ
jgi:hypothetical protein